MPEPASALTTWLDQAGRVPLLTPEQEIILSRRIKAGAGIDPQTTDARLKRKLRCAQSARNRLASANLRFVYAVAKPYKSRVNPEEFLDVLQAGSEGVIKAVDRFDPERGVKFSTYSAWWIRDRINNWFEQRSSAIRTPTTLIPKLRRIARTEESLRRMTGEASIDQIAAAIGLTPEDVIQHIRASKVLSLDQPIGSDSRLSLLDTIDTLATPTLEQDAAPSHLAIEVRGYIDQLPDIERSAIKAAFISRRPAMAAYARDHKLSRLEADNTLKLAVSRLRMLSRLSKQQTTHDLQLNLPIASLPIHEPCRSRRRWLYGLKLRKEISRS